MRILFVLSLLLAVAGCATASPDAKPSTNAQTLVPGTPNEVADALVQEMTQRQFVLTSRSDRYLSFDRPIDNAALWPKLDGAPNRLPRARVLMTLTRVGHATAVAANMVIIAAPGTKREHYVEATSLGVDPRVGDILENAQATVIADRGTSDPRTALAVAPIK